MIFGLRIFARVRDYSIMHIITYTHTSYRKNQITGVREKRVWTTISNAILTSNLLRNAHDLQERSMLSNSTTNKQITISVTISI